MTCGDLREYVFAFLDNELEAPLSIELQRHLERCHHCAREVEIERAIRKQLAARLEAAIAVPRLDVTILEQAETAPEPSVSRWRFRSIRRRALAAACIAAVVLVGGALWLAVRSGDGSRASPLLADLLVADFEHFLREGGRVQLASGDPHEVAAWLRSKTGIDVSMPTQTAGKCQLIGARKCKLDGEPAAFALYKFGNVPASLVVTRADRFDLEGMKRVEGAGRPHWVERCNGHTIVACRRDGLVHAAVSTLPEQELLCLMTGALHEGD